LATHKSAEKRARQSIRRTKRNAQTIGAVRTIEKKLHAALSANDNTKAQDLLAEFSSKILKAANKGRIHMNNASRKISRLATRVHKLATGQTPSKRA
jgi:small subunit ribosomal protein S20